MKTIKQAYFSLLLYNILFIFVGFTFATIMPEILNYPPNSINNEFEKTIDLGLNYYVQTGMIIFLALIASNIYFILAIKKVTKYKKYIGKSDNESLSQIEKIKAKCFHYPLQIYLVHATIPNIMMIIIMALTGTSLSLTLSIGILIFSLFLVIAVLAYIFSKRVFNNILTELGSRKKYPGKFEIHFADKIILFIFPIIFTAILFSTVVSDSLLDQERGDYIFQSYLNKFNDFEHTDTSIEELKNHLKSMQKIQPGDSSFIISKNDIVYVETEDKKFDESFYDFFRKYTYAEAYNHRTYGYYASGIQAIYFTKVIDGVEYAYGIMFEVNSTHTVALLVYSGLIFFICILFLMYFSRDIGKQVSSISKNLMLIGNEKLVDYDKKMVVTSNDELGDLVISFNKILDLEKQHTIQMEKNQEILVEQERLSSLGQLIGGISHNLKTPIMSISGATKALDDLITEYDKSIGNKNVTEEDFHDIAKDMREWNNKIDVYLEYMTEIINTAKGQAVSMNASMVTEFTIKELVTRIQILMKEQLMQFNCELNLINNVQDDTTIGGEISALIQVLNNLINNSIEAYNKKPGKINLKINSDASNVYIEVEDFAGGIPEHIKDKLFKQMITTKGKDGTGLGLYMCYSTIKGKFNGDLTFDSEERKGTTFKITLNKKK